MIHPWKTVSSKPVGDFRVFKVRSDEKLSPRSGEKHNFFVMESVGWVNVVAVTADDQIVMIEQYRHGSDTIELEIPGGMMDAKDGSPVIAGTRELREETGYAGTDAKIIGEIFPNPAIQNNTCYTLLVNNCELKHLVQFDENEDIVTRLVPIADIPKLISTGKIKHALVVVALTHFELKRK